MSIFEESLVKLSQHVYFLKSATNIGIIAIEEKKEIYLIDSANDEETIKMIFEFLSEKFKGFSIKAVLNTHSHADHCGGNDWLIKNTGCEIWCPKGEDALMENPTIETSLFWGGTPIHDIVSTYLHAKPCNVDYILKEKFELETCDTSYFEECDREDSSLIKIEPIELLGHFLNQHGILIEDTDGKKSFFMGDAISGRNVLKRYWIQYLLDEKKSKETLEKITTIKSDFYIPSHGDMVTEIEGLAELNLLAILETENMILDVLKTPRTMEEVLKEVADRNQIKLRVMQFAIIGSTIRSYLTGLYESGKVKFDIIENKMVWSLTNN